nr:hypothetical protein [uncultured Prevotella sp.]
MKIPSKIYIRKVHLESLAENDSSLGANLPVGKKPFPMEEDNCVEYANLSDIWNDINKSTPIANGEAFKYPIIVYAKLQGVLKVGIVITPEELANIAKLATTKFDKVLWAYVRDIVPGVKPKGL